MTREEAREILKSVKEKGFRYTMYTLGQFNEAIDMATKALEQEPKTGHWIDCDNSDDYSADGYDCSVCGVNAEYETSYCPNCGARMVESQESSEDTGIKLDEVIERYTSNAEFERTHGNLQGYLEFRQLAEWLRELKIYRRYLLKAEVEPQESEEV